MSDKTLFLVQSTFNQTDSNLDQLEHLYSENDQLVLMGDAVLFVHDQRLLNKQHIAILENDAEILVDEIPNHIQKISYAQFADLVLGFKRCIRLT